MLNWIVEKLLSLLDAVLSVLPTSPFAPYIDEFANLPFLGYLNWFLPVGKMLEVGLAWLGVIALYYVYSVIARWVKLIA